MSDKLIYKKIAEINKEIGAIAKTDRNKSQGFNFRGIDAVYNALHDLMAKHEVFSTSKITNSEKEEKPTRNGGSLFYRILKIEYSFYTVDGSSVQTEVVGEGMDSGDKASNKAMAVAHKYALLQMFTIPTSDEKDPDFDNPGSQIQNNQGSVKNGNQLDLYQLLIDASKTKKQDGSDLMNQAQKEEIINFANANKSNFEALANYYKTVKQYIDQNK